MWFLGGVLSDEVGRLEFVDLIKKWLLESPSNIALHMAYAALSL